MPRILAIFRKDFRHLWPRAAVLAGLMLLAAILDPTYSGVPAAYYEVLPSVALPLACWLVIISAIHEDKLPGDRQYWLTRPYSWKELLAAKALFIAACVNLPLLVYHAGVYAAVGIPITDHLGALLWRQVFFTAFYVLPVVALAAVTRSLGKMVAVALLSGVGLWVAGTAFMFVARRSLTPFLSTNTTTALIRAGLLAVGVGAILVLQYSRRRTGIAGSLAAALLLAVLGQASFGLSFGRETVRPANSRLFLDSDPNRHSTALPAGNPDLNVFDIPIRFEQAPSGVAMDQGRMHVRVEMPENRFLLRVANGELHDLRGGRGWLSLLTDNNLLYQTRGQPVTLSGSFEFPLFGNLRSLPLPKGQAVTVPGVGACRDTREPEGWISFSCYSPSPRAALLVGAQATIRVNWIVPPGSTVSSIPTASGFQPLAKFTSLLSYRSWEQIGNVHLIAADPLPRFRVTFLISGIRLQEFLVTTR